MARLARRDLARVTELEAELRVLPERGQTALAWLPTALIDLLGTEKAATYDLQRDVASCSIARLFARGFDGRGYKLEFQSLFRSAVLFNTVSPEPAQRNRAVTFGDLGVAWRGDIEGTTPTNLIMRDVWPRFGLHQRDQLRVLVCDGPALLAWVGAYQVETFTARQRRILQRLVPAVQSRLHVERLVASETEEILRVVFEEIPGAAFIVGPANEVLYANAAGRTMVESQRRDTLASLRSAIHDGAPSFRVTRIVGFGGGARFLAIRRGRTDESPSRLHRAASCWGLTRRQAEILRFVVAGLANRSIAAVLGLAEKTVEVHVSALLEKAQVETRSALVASVWRE
jgi:DNA-binding CsgD family transcriptional regulator